MAQKLTILDSTQGSASPGTVEATRKGRDLFLDPTSLTEALGWELKAEGLCRGGVCVPVADRQRLVRPEGIELAALAEALGQPLALDLDEGCAALGTAADERAAALATLEAPDFTLPDLEGKLHRLSDYRGRKVLLVTWASW